MCNHVNTRYFLTSHLSCRCYLERSRLECWTSLTVHGFVDSPVSWGDREHGVLRGGENFYTLLMFHDHTYHIHLATGAHDTCPPWPRLKVQNLKCFSWSWTLVQIKGFEHTSWSRINKAMWSHMLLFMVQWWIFSKTFFSFKQRHWFCPYQSLWTEQQFLKSRIMVIAATGNNKKLIKFLVSVEMQQ